MKVAIIFDNFGPYHLARLQAAGEVADVLAIQVNDTSSEYLWRPPLPRRSNFTTVTLTQSAGSPMLKLMRTHRQLRHSLKRFRPDCVFIPGWSRLYALTALAWCQKGGVPAVMMSESTEWDAPRSIWKERLKSRILSKCSAALVGGSLHSQYVRKLGVEQERIFDGYNVVDNDYFRSATTKLRQHNDSLRAAFNLPRRYFLAAARFVDQKNLVGLIKAYAGYRQIVERSTGRNGHRADQPWSLVLIGDGRTRKEIERMVYTQGLQSSVMMPGFKQYEHLPRYYGLAGVFVHASTVEPWGLVVNEAMASGLPILVSNRCGCVPDLIREGQNGFTFDPTDTNKLATLMERISKADDHLATMSRASLEIISHWGPARFGAGMKAAANLATRRTGNQLS